MHNIINGQYVLYPVIHLQCFCFSKQNQQCQLKNILDTILAKAKCIPMHSLINNAKAHILNKLLQGWKIKAYSYSFAQRKYKTKTVLQSVVNEPLSWNTLLSSGVCCKTSKIQRQSSFSVFLLSPVQCKWIYRLNLIFYKVPRYKVNGTLFILHYTLRKKVKL